MQPWYLKSHLIAGNDWLGTKRGHTHRVWGDKGFGQGEKRSLEGGLAWGS